MINIKILYKNIKNWFVLKVSGRFFNSNYFLNKLAHDKLCQYDYYRDNCPLVCVITGMERSGTTLVSQLLNGHPRIKSGVECGVLLSDIYNFNKIQPFYEWMVSNDDFNSWGWSITRADRKRLLTAQSYDEFYWLLNKFKGSAHKNKSIGQKFMAADMIFDKTPRYVYSLSNIMSKTAYKFVVTLKNPSEQYMSAKKYSRTGEVDLDTYKRQYLSAYNEICKAVELFPDRIKVVKYKDLVFNTEKVMLNIKQFIGIHDQVLLGLDQYNQEVGDLFKTQTISNRLNSFQSQQIVYKDPQKHLSVQELESIDQAFKNIVDINNL